MATEHLGDDMLAIRSGSEKFADRQHLRVGQLGLRSASLANAIGSVVGIGSSKQVPWIATSPVVAIVKGAKTSRPFARVDKLGKFMSGAEPFWSDSEMAVSAAVSCFGPRPAFIRSTNDNVAPESLDLFFCKDRRRQQCR